MKINMKVQAKDFVIALGMSAEGLQIASADTLNTIAKNVRKDYNNRLTKGKNKARNKFTMNASRVLESNPIRRNGTPRKLTQINSKVVVRNMKGGKEHYLAKLENGTTQHGNKDTLGKVPVPLLEGRVKKSYGGSISAANRLTKAKTQTLKAGGKAFGVKGDVRKNGKAWQSSGQRFAALYGYKKRGTGNLQGDLTKPFFFINNSNQLGIFKFVRNRVKQIRKLEKQSQTYKAKPHMDNSMDAIKKTYVEQLFIANAKKELMRKK